MRNVFYIILFLFKQFFFKYVNVIITFPIARQQKSLFILLYIPNYFNIYFLCDHFAVIIFYIVEI